MELPNLYREMLYWRQHHQEVKALKRLEDLQLGQGPLLLGDPWHIGPRSLGYLDQVRGLARLKPLIFFNHDGEICLIELLVQEDSGLDWQFLGSYELSSGRILLMDKRLGSSIKQQRLDLDYQEPADYWQAEIEPVLDYFGQSCFGLHQPNQQESCNLLYASLANDCHEIHCFASFDALGQLESLALVPS